MELKNMQKFIPFFQGERRIITEKLADYFEQCGLESKIHYDETLDAYILSVPEDKVNEAKKYYQEFYFKERDRVEQEEKNKDFLKNYDESNMLAKTSFDKAPLADENDFDINDYKNLSDVDENIAAAAENDNEDPDETGISDDTDYSEDSNYTGNDLSNQAINTDMDDDSALTNNNVSSDNTALSDASAGQDEETEIEEDNEAEDEDKAALRRLLSGSGRYVFKSEKYKDYIGTFYIFLLLGIAGVIFVILNLAKVLNILNGLFPNLIMGVLFIFFIYEGITSGIKAKRLKEEAKEEDQLTEKINEWLQKTVTKEFLDSIGSDKSSEELDYIKKAETIQDLLIKEFGDINTDYLDRLIEEFYNKNFE